jgi:hypothetical protein
MNKATRIISIKCHDEGLARDERRPLAMLSNSRARMMEGLGVTTTLWLSALEFRRALEWIDAHRNRVQTAN